MEMEETTQKRSNFKNEVVVKLDTPVEWGDDIISEVRLKRPKGRHIKNFGDDVKVGDMLKLASKVSGISMGVFEEMESPDCMKVAEAMGDLL